MAWVKSYEIKGGGQEMAAMVLKCQSLLMMSDFINNDIIFINNDIIAAISWPPPLIT